VPEVWQVKLPFHSADQASTSFGGASQELEEALTDGGETGFFSRVAWGNRATETFAYTEADVTSTASAQVAGSGWGRLADRAGIGVVGNALSSAHAGYLAAHGPGFELGDRPLSCRPVTIFESYHLAQLMPRLRLTADYQFITDPGHDRARGPASVVSAAADAEMPPEASANQPFDWNGWYAGGRLGLATGSSNWSATRGGAHAPAPSGSLGLSNPIHFSDGTGSYFGGLQAGYDKVLPSRILLGLETDAMFPNTVSGAQTRSPRRSSDGRATGTPCWRREAYAAAWATYSTRGCCTERAGSPGPTTS
jgi:opacity protein-like surface antigen